MSEAPGGAAANEPTFFPVGLRKFALMHLATLGLYELHWFYENWWLIKNRRKARFNPGTRTFFAPLFAWALFREVRRAADEERIPTAFSPSGATLVYLLGALSGIALVDHLWPVPLVLLYVPLHVTQHLMNQVNAIRAPVAERNETLSLSNKIALAVGGILVGLALWSSFQSIAESP